MRTCARSGPSSKTPPCEPALADQIVNELYAHVDVAAALQTALPDSADQFAPTLAASIKSTSVQLAADALAVWEGVVYVVSHPRHPAPAT